MPTTDFTVDGEKRAPREVEAVDIFSFFKLLLAEDERFRIIKLLASREGANMREIGRRTGISYRKVSRSLTYLVEAGVVDFYFVGIGLKVYKLSSKCEVLRNFNT
jgi:DNA-binding transcriptional ArsR family regulator